MAEGFKNVVATSQVDETAVTLATTMKTLIPASKILVPANFFNRVGKQLKLSGFGKLTTDGTAGNYVAEAGYGSGDAPTPLQAGATVAGTISQTNISFRFEVLAECRAIGTAGVLRLTGLWVPAVAVLASTLQPYTIPASAPADQTVDTTVGTNALTFQLQRSGAGVWTATVTNWILESPN